MRTIRLYRTPVGWFAQYVNDTEVIDALGTDTILTAFTANADPEFVRREIERLNPNTQVVIEE